MNVCEFKISKSHETLLLEAFLFFMTHDVAANEVDDIFSDAAHKVTDALQFTTAAVHEHPGGFGIMVRAHQFDALFEQSLVQRINGLIADDDRAALFDVLRDEGS